MQSGVEYRYWREAMKGWCCKRNFFDKINGGPFEGKMPDEAKFNETVRKLHPRMLGRPFGAKVEWMPLNKKARTKIQRFREKTCEAIFVGYRTYCGLSWGEGCLVIDAHTFQNAPANQCCHVSIVRDIFECKDLSFPARGGAWKPKMPSLEGLGEGVVQDDLEPVPGPEDDDCESSGGDEEEYSEQGERTDWKSRAAI